MSNNVLRYWELIEISFSSLSFRDKIEQVKIGNPTPNLPNLIQNCSKF